MHDQAISLSIIGRGKQSIHYALQRNDKLLTWLTLVYAANTTIERRDVWESIKNMRNLAGNKAWPVCGDFNVVREEREASNSKESDLPGLLEFKEMLHSAGLENHA